MVSDRRKAAGTTGYFEMSAAHSPVSCIISRHSDEQMLPGVPRSGGPFIL